MHQCEDLTTHITFYVVGTYETLHFGIEFRLGSTNPHTHRNQTTYPIDHAECSAVGSVHLTVIPKPN